MKGRLKHLLSDVAALLLFFSSANVGFQPQQFDQEEQRAGKPHGEVDPDVPTCGGKAGQLDSYLCA